MALSQRIECRSVASQPGTLLGAATVRADVLPRWTGIMLAVGMAVMAATSGLPDVLRTLSAGVRDLALAGMGASLPGSGSPRSGTLRRAAGYKVPRERV
ncbi:MAG: hypothetical protein JWN62_2998 [Acidimicrobiales bacterium]|nr:hypothetical protein [Acidimicrobiales bacterium]